MRQITAVPVGNFKLGQLSSFLADISGINSSPSRLSSSRQEAAKIFAAVSSARRLQTSQSAEAQDCFRTLYTQNPPRQAAKVSSLSFSRGLNHFLPGESMEKSFLDCGQIVSSAALEERGEKTIIMNRSSAESCRET